MALADLNIVPATSATSFEYKHNYIKLGKQICIAFFFTSLLSLNPKNLKDKVSACNEQPSSSHTCWPILQDTVVAEIR